MRWGPLIVSYWRDWFVDGDGVVFEVVKELDGMNCPAPEPPRLLALLNVVAVEAQDLISQSFLDERVGLKKP